MHQEVRLGDAVADRGTGGTTGTSGTTGGGDCNDHTTFQDCNGAGCEWDFLGDECVDPGAGTGTTGGMVCGSHTNFIDCYQNGCSWDFMAQTCS